MRKTFKKPYRIKKRRSILKTKFFWLTLLVLIIISGIFYLICFSSPFQIKEIKISGNSAFVKASADKQKVSTENLEDVIGEQIEKKILFFSSKSIFLADFSKIKVKTLEGFPQIAQINLKRELPDTLTVVVEERKPIAVLNQEDLYFFIDKEGIIFENTAAEGELLKIKKAVQDKELKLGSRVLQKEFLLSILEAESKLENDLKIPIEEILVVVPDERINIKTSEGWEIYFNAKGDKGWQFTKLSEVLEKEIPPEKRGNLQYIDLRFGNFAPYKYR